MTYIHLKTEIPGPNSRAMLERRAASVASCIGRSTDIVVERAEGALVHDVDGNTLIDMAGGIGMLAAGHCPAPVVNAITHQAQQLIHPCFLVATYEPYINLCEMLAEITPGDFPKKDHPRQ
jgi:4-aminobutyrate aminotransferase / (S)-3-amino-2-methylpropionate transaminase / 5-aminovalerate transaminase